MGFLTCPDKVGNYIRSRNPGKVFGQIQMEPGSYFPGQQIQNGVVDFRRGRQSPGSGIIGQDVLNPLADLPQTAQVKFMLQGEPFGGGVTLAEGFPGWKAACLVRYLLTQLGRSLRESSVIYHFGATASMGVIGDEMSTVSNDEKGRQSEHMQTGLWPTGAGG